MTAHDWIAQELATADLGDKRRTDRAVRMVAAMAAKPQGSVPQFAKDWADTRGAYRLLSPASLRAQAHDLAAAVRAAMSKACVNRMTEQPLVLAIQDTTSFDFHTRPATRDLGPIGGGRDGKGGTGFFLHTTLAVSAKGVPLGVLWQETWARGPECLGRDGRRHKLPLQQRESHRWVEAQRVINDRLPADTTVLTVADREADFFELWATPRPENAHLLIRATGRRLFAEGEGFVIEAVRRAPVLGEYEVTIRQHPEHRARPVRLTVRALTVTLPAPKTGQRFMPHREPVVLRAIYLTETVPPAEGKGIEWLLFTDLPVPDLATAQRYVYYYTLRWLIERYHYTLKSGCRIEDSQLKTREALENLLALYCLVAWRLLWLTYVARQDETQACTVAFSDLEWRTLQRLHQPGEPAPAEPPPLRQVVRWLGRMGGHLGRTGDGEPGSKALWIGLTRLADVVTGIRLAALNQDVGKA